MGGYLKCVSPDSPNKYVVISEGDIGFYEDVNGSPKLATAITQLGLYSVTNGGTVRTEERFVTKYGMPQVFVSPRSVNIFNVNGIELDQEINIKSPVVAVDDAGRATFGVSGGLTKKTTGNGSLLVPRIEQRIWHDHNDFFDDFTSGEGYHDYVERFSAEWAVPVISAKSAVACARVYGNAMRTRLNPQQPTGWEYCTSSWNYSLRVGIGNGAGVFSWGTATTGVKPNNADPLLISASVSGSQSGSHVHVKVECSASQMNVITNSASFYSQWFGGNNPMIPLYVNCLPDEGDISASSSGGFTALVVGR
ncbi:hypothetical protein [Cloacibacillus evryensis]|uniref:hypothetical protein n=1 Tax=Cloacibacillus evryensis TaxID=508460 RepID=UPI00044D47A1|nr:hypothetical protein [Cloacibacillus evryensis]EXG78370.1 hypothetical protein Cloev_0488 [Cloacibacillus evryensis DSM 19522]MEA5034851.1 hypothetical protein [Cloacibacillus evryensis]